MRESEAFTDVGTEFTCKDIIIMAGEFNRIPIKCLAVYLHNEILSSKSR